MKKLLITAAILAFVVATSGSAEASTRKHPAPTPTPSVSPTAPQTPGLQMLGVTWE